LSVANIHADAYRDAHGDRDAHPDAGTHDDGDGNRNEYAVANSLRDQHAIFSHGYKHRRAAARYDDRYSSVEHTHRANGDQRAICRTDAGDRATTERSAGSHR
jgi:hypothetical protein